MRMRAVVVGAVVLALVGGGVLLSAARQDAEKPRIVRMTAERFSFTPSRVTLTQGDVVELRISSQDTAHGFRLVRERPDDEPPVEDEIDVVIPKRGSGDASVIFRADEVGRWTFECSRMCGAGHNFMRGEIVVVASGGGR